jgi:hypothetical protein
MNYIINTKHISIVLLLFLMFAMILGGCSSPKPTPGLSHLSKARVYKSDDSIEIKPGEAKTIEFTLETRKDGPGIFKIGGISHVSGEYSDAILPMPQGLGVNLEPGSFMAYPNSTYKSVLTITTSPELAPGEYWLHYDQEFERSFSGYGWIRVTVKP